MRILVITGAGVSAESGIPTFRGKEGYWRKLDPAKLATPEAFARDPELVWVWYRERRLRIRNARPNAGHKAIARLAHKAEEFLLVTQNVDDLHTRAGLSAEKMVQIHGDIFTTRCSSCDFSRRARPRSPGCDTLGGQDHDDVRPPRCPKCDALMRPGVVWFGEQLPWKELQRVENFFGRGFCNWVIVAGTTAAFGYIVDWALRAKANDGELIEVNPEETPLSSFATKRVSAPAAIALPRIVDELLAEHPKL
jgi:NAD-dependent deacetylase